MAIFQNSVLNKHLNFQDKSKLNAAYNKLKVYQARAKEISKFKEEEYQDGFFRDVFVNVFGYTYKYDGDPKFNLLREKKNVNDSKKADGAIIKDGEVLCVIELKDTTTRDLSKVETQAFGYFTGHSNCKYVITSNFEKLNFYIKNKIDVEEFNLFTCTFDQFQILYLCLNAENLLNNLPLKVKESSLAKDEKITKDLYKDYTAFKNEAWENLCINHPDQDKLFLYKKAQKLLDRFLFIFFGEDKGLLPENSISKIVKKWQDDSDWGDKKALYDVFRQYFSFINEGRPKRGEKEEIYPYNGGLFYADEFLDKLKLDDNLLLRHVVKLTNYDFDSQVDINILGHIFEHSLSEIEETEAKLKGEQIDKSKGKRKKDGVYYTPKYITKYIVEDTIGKLCNEKKSNLGIGNVKLDNTFITKATKPKLSAKGKDYSKKLKEYRDWLLDLKICDPACGSGAFLNQALEFLISEHNLLEIYILDLQKLLTGEGIQLTTGSRDIANEILENNIFGVDINEESVQIAKLSIWLRTAERGRKLSNLNNNIKCGNSLIDDPAIAGDKVFNWENEFPQVFAKGGFDVVIGNPPYVICQPSNTNNEILEFYKTFHVASYKIDLFHLFFEKSISLLKSDGKLGFITPNTYLNNKYIKPLREYILLNTKIDILINYKDKVFIDAEVDVATIILTKNQTKNDKIQLYESENSILKSLGNKSQGKWIEDIDNIFNLNKTFEIKFENCVNLKDVCSSYFGIQAYDRKSTVSDVKENENYLPIIDGGDINKFSYATPNKYLNYLPEKIKSGGNYDVYSEKRIVISQIGLTPIVGLCESNILASNTLYNINLKDRTYSLNYLLCILNSKLLKSYWISKYSDGKKLFPKIKGFQLKELPIKIADKQTQEPLTEKAEQMLSLNKNLQDLAFKFQRTLQRKFESLENLPKKLENWYELTFTDFVKELKKKKIKLALTEEAEWEDYFLVEQQKAIEIKAQITKLYKEIDVMVYELYGLTDEEVAIIEND